MIMRDDRGSFEWYDASEGVRTADLAELAGTLKDRGIAFLRGVVSDEVALNIARQLGDIRNHRDSDNDGVTRIIAKPDGGRSGYMAFTNSALFPHTDRSVNPCPPPIVMLWCEQPSKHGGESLLVDGCEVYHRMKAVNPAAHGALGTRDSTIFGSGGEFYSGAVFETIGSQRIRVRFRNDDLLYPSPAVSEYIQVLVGYIEASAHIVRLDQGEAYILQNTRWMHGRLPYEGNRRYGRLHIDPMPDLMGALSGFDLPMTDREVADLSEIDFSAVAKSNLSVISRPYW